jgi:MFS family permease
LIFRFLAALGIGGEWAVGSSLLSETWPRRWRAWVAAVLQTGVNVGVLLACLANFAMSGVHEKKWVFLVGIVPALIVYWIRRAVPEPAEWHAARVDAAENPPGVADLFRGNVRRITILTIIVCATSLTGWWAFMFWHVQHLRSLSDVVSWEPKKKDQLVTFAFFLVIGWSIVGNFFAAWVARLVGYRRTIAIMSLMFCLIIAGTYWHVRDYKSMLFWIPWVGFCSGMFGLFTMYLPPLFPTLLRTTGAGFCYNIGRIAAAAGTVIFAFVLKGIDFRMALFYTGFLFIPAMIVAMMLPDLHDKAPQAT